MIEIYLFVNPLGGLCFSAEKAIMEMANGQNKRFHFRFIPIVNMKSVNACLTRLGISHSDLEKRNHFFETSYSAALDLKAMQLQGRKKGREFLFAIQKAVTVDKQEYSKNLVLEIVRTIGADIEMFIEDRQSELVKKSFASDQQIGHEMGVVTLPSAVVFNFYGDEDGMIIEEDIPENIRRFFSQQSSMVAPSKNVHHLKLDKQELKNFQLLN
ncbi:MAG: DsbA family protein [Lactobacillales bacterium]|jgi:predicted DsbA family dithiol-disulfide isomerase|nr:DsbA family protein [Lactobacillales bacterium]